MIAAVNERFDAFIYTEPNSGCHLFAGGCGTNGYGQFWLNGKKVAAHRFAWERSGRRLPPELHVLHKCDTPCCVNPDHLFLGADQDNADDKCRKLRRPRRPHPFGVSPNRKGIYRSSVTTGGTKRHLGCFASWAVASALAFYEKNIWLERAAAADLIEGGER